MVFPTASSDSVGRPPVVARRGHGYNLVALVVILVVINIAVAVAMPMWSHVTKREREAELLFRGWQYAEAIRVFQARFGRYPVTLEELIEVKPRCIRQLWEDPLSDSGAWKTILAGSGQRQRGAGSGNLPGDTPLGQEVGGGRPPGGRPTIKSEAGDSEEGPTAFDRPGAGAPGSEGAEIGPIEGVRPSATGESLKSFLGRTEYAEWEFRATILAAQSLSPNGVPRSPRIGSDSLSRPLPEGAELAQTLSPQRPTPDSGPRKRSRDEN